MNTSIRIQKLDNQTVNRNLHFEARAEQFKPGLHEQNAKPGALVQVVKDADATHGWRCDSGASIDAFEKLEFGKGASCVLDFGAHQVGYLSLQVMPKGSPPDAPLHLRITFGEMPVEVAEPFSEYKGWISSSWLQEELLHIDTLPAVVELPRRYSFRYVKLEVLDTSPKYKVSFAQVSCTTVTSANSSIVNKMSNTDPVLQQIDQVSIKTLQDCMQDVFEDGPKRDRRLWLGDLYLQALANYETFKNNDLVKRCLYLFAAVPNHKGQVAANLFTSPYLIPDDTYLFDYSLLFVSTLHDYYVATEDKDTLLDLWPTALRQIEVAFERLDANHIVQDDETWWSFIDWHEDLNKQASSQAILVFALKKAIKMAEVLENNKAEFLWEQLQLLVSATVRHFWDWEKRFFVSGAKKQVSWASQIWMVMAGVLDKEQSRLLMNRLLVEKPSIGPTTPYLYHFLVEALLLVGETEEAIMQMKKYWGRMLEDGADTFWELYDPNNREYSPYGSHLINSYCHAWSCTPTYLIRKYKLSQ